MLGEKIAEGKGTATGRRVLDGHRVETSFQSQGTLLGIDAQDMGTYVSEMRPDGTLFGEGQGVAMGPNGEMARWVGHGVGNVNDDGSVSFRGCVYYYSETPNWQKLNGFACCFEHEVDAEGNVSNELWEWK